MTYSLDQLRKAWGAGRWAGLTKEQKLEKAIELENAANRRLVRLLEKKASAVTPSEVMKLQQKTMYRAEAFMRRIATILDEEATG